MVMGSCIKYVLTFRKLEFFSLYIGVGDAAAGGDDLVIWSAAPWVRHFAAILQVSPREGRLRQHHWGAHLNIKLETYQSRQFCNQQNYQFPHRCHHQQNSQQ